MRKQKAVSTVASRPARYVVVALRMAGIAGQDKLNGIFGYLSEQHRWRLSIYRTVHEFTAETVRSEIAKGADGFLVGIPGVTEALTAIAKTSIPTVLLNVEGGPLMRRTRGLALVRSDAEDVGRQAADTLLSQGIYKSYGYVGYRTDCEWSLNRGTAFRSAIEKAGFVTRMFDSTHFMDKNRDNSVLAVWLRHLPKPCGLLAACDDRAFEVLDVCRDIGLTVPSEIGILGVNNDPLLCENAVPKLSSVQPDFKQEGRLAAELLERMMSNGGKIPGKKEEGENPRTFTVGVRMIVHRESTVPASNAGKLVQKALAFIEANAMCKINVTDVVNHLKVSRSLAELRFRELQHETIRTAIVRARMEELKRRLVSSRDTIEKISFDCGWTNPNAAKNLFKSRFGISMRDFRNG